MATKFFMRSDPSHLGGSGQLMMRPFRGGLPDTCVINTAASGTNIQFTKTAGGTAVAWYSMPLASGVTISGSITCNVRGFENSTAANCGFNIKIERCNSAGVVQSTILATTAVNATELGAADAASASASLTPTSTAMSAGDVIKVTLGVTNAGGTMTTGHTVTASFAGQIASILGDTWVNFTETIAEAPPANHVWVRQFGLAPALPATATMVTSFASATISGNVIAAIATTNDGNGAGTATGATVTGGNVSSWTRLDLATAKSDSESWWGVSSGGTTGVTVTDNLGNDFPAVSTVELEGVDTGGTPIAHHGKNSATTTSTSMNPGTATLDGAGQLVMAGGYTFQGVAAPYMSSTTGSFGTQAGAGTTTTNPTGDCFNVMTCIYVTASGTVTPTWAVVSTAGWDCVYVVFNPVSPVVNANPAPSSVVGGTTFGTDQVSTGTVAAPSAIVGQMVAGTEVVGIGYTVAPAAIAGSAVFGTVVIRQDATATPSTIIGATTFGTSTESVGSNLSPVSIAATTTIPTPAFSSAATAMANSVVGNTIFGTQAVKVGSTLAPSSIVCTTTVPTPGFSSSANPVPASIVGTEVAGTNVATAGSSLTSTAIAGTTTFGTPVENAGSNAIPSSIIGATTFGTSAEAVGSTISPSSIVGATTVPTPSVSVAGNANVTGSAIVGAATIPAPAIHVGVTITTVAIAGVTTFGSQAVAVGITTAPSSIVGATTIPAPTIHVGSTAIPGAIVGILTFGSQAVKVGSVITASVVIGGATIPTPQVVTDQSVSPSCVVSTTIIPTPTITSSVSIEADPPTIVGTTIFTSPTVTSPVLIVAVSVKGTLVMVTPVVHPSLLGRVKIWNGTAWVAHQVKIFDTGTNTWIPHDLKYWNGSFWTRTLS